MIMILHCPSSKRPALVTCTTVTITRLVQIMMSSVHTFCPQLASESPRFSKNYRPDFHIWPIFRKKCSRISRIWGKITADKCMYLEKILAFKISTKSVWITSQASPIITRGRIFIRIIKSLQSEVKKSVTQKD